MTASRNGRVVHVSTGAILRTLSVLLTIVLGIAASGIASTASAQPYPSKPVVIVVAYSAGGGTDLLARLLAEKLSPRIGQPVVVENRPGATGTIGSSFVSKAAPDGYTLLLTPGTLPFAQMVLKTGVAAYDPIDGFTPVIKIGEVPLFLVAGPATGFRNFKEMIAAARTKTLSYGTAGTGSIHHILGEMVKQVTGARLEHVPYKGVAPAVNDLLGGHIPLMYASLDTVNPYLPSGKVIPLAVFDAQRTSLAPGVPTMREMGYDLELTTWYGLFGPKGMPQVVVKTLNDQLNEIVKMADVVARMREIGIRATAGSPQVLGTTNTQDYERFGKIIKELDIRAE